MVTGISFVDLNNGTAVGDYGTILRTTNGGTTWTSQTSGTTADLYGVSFSDANNGTAVGMFGTTLRTTDGGTIWTLQTATSYNLESVSFTDANNGTAVGEAGTILRTTNGGATFVGDENNLSLPKGFVLEQNFPNPFNPNTNIQYAVSNPANGTGRQFVSLKIYDMLGREVATLVNEEKEPGIYRAEFNTQDYQLASGISAKGGYASGVYLVRPEAGSYVETRKMGFLK